MERGKRNGERIFESSFDHHHHRRGRAQPHRAVGSNIEQRQHHQRSLISGASVHESATPYAYVSDGCYSTIAEPTSNVSPHPTSNSLSHHLHNKKSIRGNGVPVNYNSQNDDDDDTVSSFAQHCSSINRINRHFESDKERFHNPHSTFPMQHHATSDQYMNQKRIHSMTNNFNDHRRNRRRNEQEISTYTNIRDDNSTTNNSFSEDSQQRFGTGNFSGRIGAVIDDEQHSAAANINQQTLRRRNQNIGQSSTIPSLHSLNSAKIIANIQNYSRCGARNVHERSQQSIQRREFLKDYKRRTALGTIFRERMRSSTDRISPSQMQPHPSTGSVHTSPWRQIDHLSISNDEHFSRQQHPFRFIRLTTLPSNNDELYPLYGKNLKVISDTSISYRITHANKDYFIPKSMAQPIFEPKDVYGSRPPSVRSADSGGEWCQVDMVVEAVRDYSPMNDGELNVDVGDMPTTGMARGYSMGQYGNFPFEIVRQISDKRLRGCKAEALFNYFPTNSDEIPMNIGDSLVILETRLEDPGWWKCLRENEVGIFPAAYLQIFLDSNVDHGDDDDDDDDANSVDRFELEQRSRDYAIEVAPCNRANTDSEVMRNSTDSLRTSSNSCTTKMQQRMENAKRGTDLLEDVVQCSSLHTSPSQSALKVKDRNEQGRSVELDMSTDDMRAGVVDMANMVKSNKKEITQIHEKLAELSECVRSMEKKFNKRIDELDAYIKHFKDGLVKHRHSTSN